MSKKTAYKRRDGRWECRISMGKDENGRRVFRSFYGKSLLSQEQCSTASLKYCITQICRHSTITACAIYLQQGVSNWALM